MTKKEQAEMEALRRDLRIARAWRRTEPVAPDVPPPDRGASKGWYVFAYLKANSGVVKAMSESHSHFTGEKAWERADAKTWEESQRFGSGTQGGLRLYSSKLLALKAARAKLEADMAMELAAIDELIEREQSS